MEIRKEKGESLIGIAKNMTGEEFTIGDPLTPTLFGPWETPKKNVVVTRGFSKGSCWQDTGLLDLQNLYSEQIFDAWIIKSIKNTDGNKIITFTKAEIEGYEAIGESIDDAYFKELLETIDLSEENLKKIIKSLLMNVFTADLLQQLLDHESIEFIFDDVWMYLKAGNTAYRV